MNIFSSSLSYCTDNNKTAIYNLADITPIQFVISGGIIYVPIPHCSAGSDPLQKADVGNLSSYYAL